MLLTLIGLSVIAAGPGYSVVAARRIGIDAAKATELTAECAAALEAQHAQALGSLVPVDVAAAKLAGAGFPDAAVCNGAAACVASLAKVSGLSRLVSLQLVKLGGDLAIDASVVDGQTGASLAAVTRTVKLKAAKEGLQALAAELVARLPPPAPPANAVAPPEPPERPAAAAAPPSPPVMATAPREAPPAARSPWTWAPGAAGVVAAGVSSYFFVQAQSAADQIHALIAAPDDARALQLKSQGDQALYTGVALAVVGAAGVATTAILLGTGPSAQRAQLLLAPIPGGGALAVMGRFP